MGFTYRLQEQARRSAPDGGRCGICRAPVNIDPAKQVRVLADTGSEVMVTSLDLDYLTAQAAHLAAPKASDDEARFQRPYLHTAFVEPEGPVENELAAIWQSLLGIEAVGAEDDFFELGGH